MAPAKGIRPVGYGHRQGIWVLCLVLLWTAFDGLSAAGEPARTKGLKQGHLTSIRGLVCSPDGRTVVTVGDDAYAIAHWDLRTGRLLAYLNDFEGVVKHAALSPEGRYLLVRLERGDVRLYDLKAARLKRRWPATGWKDDYSHFPSVPVAVSLDARQVLLPTPAGAVVYDGQTGNEVRRIAIDSTRGLVAHFSPTGTNLAISGGVRATHGHGGKPTLQMDASTHMIDLRTGVSRRTFNGVLVGVSQDGRFVTT